MDDDTKPKPLAAAPPRFPPSDTITTRDEAIGYYRDVLAARIHEIDVYGVSIKLFFERAATHCYSKEHEPVDEIPKDEVVRWRRSPTRIEERRFSLERARLMEQIIPSIEKYSIAVVEGRLRDEYVIYGPRLGDYEKYLLVAARADGDRWRVLSAYPVGKKERETAFRSRRSKFPPRGKNVPPGTS